MLVQNIRDNDEMQTLYIYINDASGWSSVEPVFEFLLLVHNCT